MLTNEDSKQKVIDIGRREIEIEDDMLGLYTEMIKDEVMLKAMDPNDKDVAMGILNIVLSDTARHKKIMEEIISNL